MCPNHEEVSVRLFKSLTHNATGPRGVTIGMVPLRRLAILRKEAQCLKERNDCAKITAAESDILEVLTRKMLGRLTFRERTE